MWWVGTLASPSSPAALSPPLQGGPRAPSPHPNRTRPYGIPIPSSGFDHVNNGLARHNHHLNPGKLVINTTSVNLGQLHIIGHHIADFVQRLFKLAARVNLPDMALVESITPRLLLCCHRVTHADIPQFR